MSGAAGPRRRGRVLVFRLLYQAELTHDDIATLWQSAKDDERLPDEAREYVEALVGALADSLPEYDRRIESVLERWNLERLAVTDKSVLRLATAEFAGLPGTPARVVIDEAVAIAKKYGREESGRFVNGVLDRLARELRKGELEELPEGRGAAPRAAEEGA